MIITFHILSRAKGDRLSYEPLETTCIVISVTDPDSAPAQFHRNPQIKSVLRLSFEDVDTDTAGAMTKEDAERIVSFVKRWKTKVPQIIVHCEAGISRSAGICAALMLWLTGSDQAVFDDPQYRPNMGCNRLVLNEIQEEIDHAIR